MITPSPLVVNTTSSTSPVRHAQSEPLREVSSSTLGWMDNSTSRTYSHLKYRITEQESNRPQASDQSPHRKIAGSLILNNDYPQYDECPSSKHSSTGEHNWSVPSSKKEAQGVVPSRGREGRFRLSTRKVMTIPERIFSSCVLNDGVDR